MIPDVSLYKTEESRQERLLLSALFMACRIIGGYTAQTTRLALVQAAIDDADVLIKHAAISPDAGEP